jgi:hypothetical protein
MPTKGTSSLTRDTADASKAADEPLSVVVMVDRRTFLPVGEDHRDSPIGQVIDSCVIPLCSQRPAEGYIAVCAVGTADWHQLMHRREVFDWQEGLTRRLKPLVKTALRVCDDSPDKGAKPSFVVEQAKLWLRVFCDLELVLVKKRVHDYISLTQSWARKPVSPTQPAPRKPLGREAPWRQQLADLLATIPKDAPYPNLAKDFRDLEHDLRRQFAVRIQPALTTVIRKMPQDTYPQKQEVARWVNTELKELNLSICHRIENDQYPAILIAHSGHQYANGRFRLEFKRPDGTRGTALLPDAPLSLELMEAPTRPEGIVKALSVRKSKQNKVVQGK